MRRDLLTGMCLFFDDEGTLKLIAMMAAQVCIY